MFVWLMSFHIFMGSQVTIIKKMYIKLYVSIVLYCILVDI